MAQTSMQGKVVLITGGTAGIGKATALALARMGAQVIVTGRDPDRGSAALEDLRAESGSDRIDLLLADLTLFSEAQRLVEAFRARYTRLDVLINNVGYIGDERTLTVEGLEPTFAMNVLLPIYMAQTLMPLLRASAPSRVITLKGGMPVGGIDFNNLQAEKSFLPMVTYTHSKHAMMAAHYAYAERLKGSGVTVNVTSPKPADTDMTRTLTPNSFPLVMRLMWPMLKRSLSTGTAQDSAASTVYVASMPDLDGVTGTLFNMESKASPWQTNLIAGDIPERMLQVVDTTLTEKAPGYVPIGVSA